MANRLTPVQRKWLIVAHLLFAVAWLGTAIVFLAMRLMAADAQDGPSLKTLYTIMLQLDDTLIIGAALGTLITGVLLCVLTQWGLFRYPWLIAKELLTILCLLLGGLWLNGLLDRVVAMTSGEGLAALRDPAYVGNTSQLMVGGYLELIAMTAAVALSVLKPWGRREPGRSKSS